MYALVYFEDSQTTDVLKKSDLENKEGAEEVVIATYGEERFEGVILKENKNSGPLRKIAVSKEGVILKPSDPGPLSEKMRAMKSNKSSATKTRKKALQELSSNLLARRSIFTDKTDDLRNHSASSKEKSIETQAMDEISDEEEYPEKNTESGEESEKEAFVIEESVSEAKISIKSDKRDFVIDRAIYDLKEVLRNLESVSVKDNAKCAAMIKKNLPAFKKKEGSIERQPNSKVYINELDEGDVLRFTDRPKEMIRRLFKYLVKPENLIKMVPIGNASKIGIPEKIRKAVFWYVNKKASTKIDYVTFMETVSSQCVTLRNPNKKTPKKKETALKLARKATQPKSKKVGKSHSSLTESSAPGLSERSGQVSPLISSPDFSDYPDKLDGLDGITDEFTVEKVAAPFELQNNHSYETEETQPSIGVKSTIPGEVVTKEIRVDLNGKQSDSGHRKQSTSCSPSLQNHHQSSNSRSRSKSRSRSNRPLHQKSSTYGSKQQHQDLSNKTCSRSRSQSTRSQHSARRSHASLEGSRNHSLAKKDSQERRKTTHPKNSARSRRPSRSPSRSRRSRSRSRSRRLRSRSRSWRSRSQTKSRTSRSRTRSRRSRPRSRSRRSRSRRSKRSRY